MKQIKQYIKEINEAKEYFIKTDKILVYGGDHELDRMFDRNIKRDIIEKTLNGIHNKLINLINYKSIKIGDEFIIRNKNLKPYLNLPVKYIEIKNNKHIFVLKTGMYKNDYKTSNKIIDIYA